MPSAPEASTSVSFTPDADPARSGRADDMIELDARHRGEPDAHTDHRAGHDDAGQALGHDRPTGDERPDQRARRARSRPSRRTPAARPSAG